MVIKEEGWAENDNFMLATLSGLLSQYALWLLVNTQDSPIGGRRYAKNS